MTESRKRIAEIQKRLQGVDEALKIVATALDINITETFDDHAPAQLRFEFADVVAAANEVKSTKMLIVAMHGQARDTKKTLTGVVELLKRYEFATQRRFGPLIEEGEKEAKRRGDRQEELRFDRAHRDEPSSAEEQPEPTSTAVSEEKKPRRRRQPN